MCSHARLALRCSQFFLTVALLAGLAMPAAAYPPPHTGERADTARSWAGLMDARLRLTPPGRSPLVGYLEAVQAGRILFRPEGEDGTIAIPRTPGLGVEVWYEEEPSGAIIVLSSVEPAVT